MHRTLPAPILAALIVATTLVGVLAVAVHHDSSPTKITAGSAPKSGGSTPSAGTTPSGSSSTTTAPAPGSDTTGPSPTTTTPTAAPTTTAGRPGVTTATTRPTTATTHPATTAPPSTASGPAPTRPGRYTYTQTGSSPGPATLDVGAPSGGVETWVRNDGSNTATTVLLFDGSGVYTVSLTELGATCTPTSPLAWPPWPVAVGATFSAQATCSAPLKATLDVMGHVTGTETVLVGGASINTFVVTTTISGSGVTLTETDSYAPSLRLAVKTHLVLNGVPGVAFDQTSTLVSATPA